MAEKITRLKTTLRATSLLIVFPSRDLPGVAVSEYGVEDLQVPALDADFLLDGLVHLQPRVEPGGHGGEHASVGGEVAALEKEKGGGSWVVGGASE